MHFTVFITGSPTTAGLEIAVVGGAGEQLVEVRYTPAIASSWPPVEGSRELAKLALTRSWLAANCNAAHTPVLGISCIYHDDHHQVSLGVLDASWRFWYRLYDNFTAASLHDAPLPPRRLVREALRLASSSPSYSSDVASVPRVSLARPHAQLTDGDVTHIVHHPPHHCRAAMAAVNPPPPPGLLVFPGSFNPLHRGHLAIAALAQARFPRSSSALLWFELSVHNADKGSSSTDARVSQFAPLGLTCVCTKASLFVDKARLFPGCTFVLGADTVVRLVDAKYYGGGGEMIASLASIIHQHQCRFLVAGRLMVKKEGGFFSTCQQEVDAALPPSLAAAFSYLTEAEFRVDLSSTQLRQEQQQQQKQHE